MINFDEEIRKYHPSLEIDQAEDAIYNTDMTDMVDVMLKMTEGSTTSSTVNSSSMRTSGGRNTTSRNR